MKNFWGNNLQRICLGIAVIIVGAFLINYFSEKSIAKRNIEDYLSRNVNDFSYYEPVEYGNLHHEYGLFGYYFKDSISYSNTSLGLELNSNAPELLFRDGLYYLKTQSGEMKIADNDSKMNYFEDPNGNLGVWIRVNSRMKRKENYDECVSEGKKRVDSLVREHKKEFAKQKRSKSSHNMNNRTDFSDLDWWLFTNGARFRAEDECGKEYYESNPFIKFDKAIIMLNNKYPLDEKSNIAKPSLLYTLYHTFRINNGEGNKVLLKRTFNLNDKLDVTSSYSND